MSGSRLPDEGPGFLPKKVAELLRSDVRVAASLERASSLVRTLGLSARVIDRMLVGSPDVTGDTLAILARGVCERPGFVRRSVLEAFAGDSALDGGEAALVAVFADYARSALSRSGIDPRPVVATAWATAETAHWLARRHIVDPEEAFVTALFMDTGLVAMMYTLPEVYLAFAQSSDARSVLQFEQESLGFDHQEVGSAVLLRFKFPEPLAQFAALHHLPSLEQDMVGKVLHAASVAVGSVGGDFGLSTVAPEMDAQTLESALIKPSDGGQVRDYASARLEAALRFKWPAGSEAA